MRNLSPVQILAILRGNLHVFSKLVRISNDAAYLIQEILNDLEQKGYARYVNELRSKIFNRLPNFRKHYLNNSSICLSTSCFMNSFNSGVNEPRLCSVFT